LATSSRPPSPCCARRWPSRAISTATPRCTSPPVRLCRARPPQRQPPSCTLGLASTAAIRGRPSMTLPQTTEDANGSPRCWVRRVLDGPVVVALDTGEADGNRLADHAQLLGGLTAGLVADAPDAVVPRSTLVAALREIEPPVGAPVIADAVLAELGAALAP